MLCYGKQVFFRKCTVTVGKINLGLKANVLTIPFSVKEMTYMYMFILGIQASYIWTYIYMIKCQLSN